ncbi:hypothetical protein FIU86_17215 [Roseovarius sp. THAF9]|uniref:FkbM family methyltransferase n=1 Tax=Roseovarius sp. THAF9 TaxID=2587847 RepID=UPI0012689E65|nr:FkbM family methyltransferase [Roseovarius sp. THAF9]QFT94595.1 hypothetical protein FIU86_17215 [Roseovarius sp. THAF9]
MDNSAAHTSADRRTPREKTTSLAPETRTLTFSGPGAQLQYAILMALFHVALNRSLFGIFARGLGRIFPADNSALIGIDGAPPFRVSLNDGYWTRFALWHQTYEPEIARLLAAAAPLSDLFCDLGANKGYWTLRASTRFKQIIAVEAAAKTFSTLKANVGHLPNVALERAAIHAQSGQRMTFVNVANSHASSRLLNGGAAGEDNTTETVYTRSIDDLVPAGQPALIKLDVEGAELSAFAGATRALRDGAVIIYEEHGSDPTCAVTRHLLEQPNLQVYCYEDALLRLNSVAAVRALKTDRYKGYNLLAARADSPLLRGIVQSSPYTDT